MNVSSHSLRAGVVAGADPAFSLGRGCRSCRAFQWIVSPSPPELWEGRHRGLMLKSFKIWWCRKGTYSQRGATGTDTPTRLSPSPLPTVTFQSDTVLSRQQRRPSGTKRRLYAPTAPQDLRSLPNENSGSAPGLGLVRLCQVRFRTDLVKCLTDECQFWCF